MRETRVTAEAIARVARQVVGSAVVEVEHHPVGFGAENWKVRDDGGHRYVVKVGDRTSEAKWRSSQLANELAHAAGLPVPELIHHDEVDGHLVRVFTWIEGHSAATIQSGDRVRSDRLLRSVGEAVRALHGIKRDEFSSRLDGSAPSFAAWADYIDYRLSQIRARCEATAAVGMDVVDRACDVASALSAAVNETADAVLCHRDLHPGNLVVDDGGTLIGIIDWDGAESWDRAGDWFKLEYELLHTHPDGEDLLAAAYFGQDELPLQWDERRRLVHIIETLNILPNAASNDWPTEFAERARAHLHHLLNAA